METSDYIKYIVGTVENYPKKLKNHLMKIFVDNKIVIKDKNKIMQISFDEIGLENVADLSLDEQLSKSLSGNIKAIKLFENWEFIKDYKYSIMLNTNDYDLLLDKISNIKKVKEEDACFKYDGTFLNPIFYEDNQYKYLKFNLLYSSYDVEERKNILLKYPFLVVFNIKYKYIEFRFDTLKSMYLANKFNNYIYRNLIDNMIRYFQENFEIILSPLNLSFFRNITKQERAELKLIAQSMRFRNGGQAELEVGNNEEYLLPFVDELTSLIQEYSDQLNSIPEFKNALNEYINEMINMSDYPWVVLVWVGDVSSKNNKVKFIFNYMGEEYTLMQHMYSQSLIGMERMNHVTEYIIENRKYCE